MSLRDIVQSANDIEKLAVEVPQWGVTVEVRSMSLRDRTRMLQGAISEDGSNTVSFERLYPDLVILCTFDPATNEPAFTEADREMLLSKAAAPVELIATAAMKVSGLSSKAVDDAGKDSSTIPSDVPTST